MVVLEWLCWEGVGEVQHGECKTSKHTFGEPFQIVYYIVPKDR